jgi:hypothetical protein
LVKDQGPLLSEIGVYAALSFPVKERVNGCAAGGLWPEGDRIAGSANWIW